MSDLRLTNGDLAFGLDGDLQIVDGGEAIAQRLKLRLSIGTGEWFLDTSFGIPWLDEVLVRNPDITRISAIFRERIVTCPGVLSISYFNLQFNPKTSHLQLDFRVVTEQSEVLVATSESGALLDETADFAQLIQNLLIRPSGSIG